MMIIAVITATIIILICNEWNRINSLRLSISY